MSNNFESSLGDKTVGVDGDCSLQADHDNDSNKDGGKQESAKSSDGKSTPPDTSDDATSDGCKPPSIQTDDGNYDEAQTVARERTASHRIANNSFAMQLMGMLNSEAENGSDAVQWLPNGRGFIIKRQNEFEQHILPRYFDSPCIFQSFLRRLYRWGFKQIDKSASGSGNYVFTNEVFHRENDVYRTMKPLPRHKSESQKAMKDRKRGKKSDSFEPHYSATGRSWSDGNSMEDSNPPAIFLAHGVNAQPTASSDSTTQASGGVAVDENTTRLPRELAAQNEILALLNAIAEDYSSLQNDSATIAPSQLNPIQQQIQTLRNYMNPNSPSNFQESPVSIVDRAIRSLAQVQGHSIILPPGEAPNFLPPNIMQQVPGQAPNFLPPTNDMSTMQEQVVVPSLFPGTIQGVDLPEQQTVARLSAPNLHLLMEHQQRIRQTPGIQARRYIMHSEETVIGPNVDTPTTSASSSSDDPSGVVLGPNVDTTTTSTPSSLSQDQLMPLSTMKRARSPSSDE